jgi:hypothetical protein
MRFLLWTAGLLVVLGSLLTAGCGATYVRSRPYYYEGTPYYDYQYEGHPGERHAWVEERGEHHGSGEHHQGGGRGGHGR